MNALTQTLNPHAAFPEWTRMPDHYATFREFQSDRHIQSWRLEEAMFRLLGRGYAVNRVLPESVVGAGF